MFVLFLLAKPHFQLLGCFDRAWNSTFCLLFPPIFSLLSSWHKQNLLTTQLDLSLLPLIPSYPWSPHPPCTWEQKNAVLHSISPCTEKDLLLFRLLWAWCCPTIKNWMSKVTVKLESFLCLLVYADIHLSCSKQWCPLHKALLQQRLMQLLRRLFVMLIELAPEPRFGEWCNLSFPSSTWKIAFRAITLASFMCLKFQNDENKENK